MSDLEPNEAQDAVVEAKPFALRFFSTDQRMTVGDDPSLDAGISGEPLVDFNPEWACLIYMRASFGPGLAIEILRLHFRIRAADEAPKRDLRDIRTSALAWINFLNGKDLSRPLVPEQPSDPQPVPQQVPANGSFTVAGGAPPDENYYWVGLTNFAFAQQHHVVIYFRNPGVEFSDRPISFSKDMIGRIMDVGPVSTGNYSFYSARSWEATPKELRGEVSRKFVHMKNYYQVYDGRDYRPIRNGGPYPDRVGYSLNINAKVASAYNDGGMSALPIIIDPDTGNMGEGQP